MSTLQEAVFTLPMERGQGFFDPMKKMLSNRRENSSSVSIPSPPVRAEVHHHVMIPWSIRPCGARMATPVAGWVFHSHSRVGEDRQRRDSKAKPS